MKNLPKRIYLNIGDGVPDDVDFRDLEEVTWSEERINDNDIAFTRKPQWISVEEELPEEGQAIIIRVIHKEVKSGKIFESYFDTFYFEQYGFEIEERPQRGKISKVIHWMPKPDLPIPSLPDTNTEKK